MAVRVADKESAVAAIEGGADAVYIGGDVYRPHRPWTLAAIEDVVDYAHARNKLVVVGTPRTAMRRECGELEQFLKSLEVIRPDAVCVGNLGTLEMAHRLTALPVQADFSMNICNHGALEFLKAYGVKMATASFELPPAALRAMLQRAGIPLEVVIHGAYAAMICDHNIPVLSLSPDPFADAAFFNRRYALLDEAGERHPIRVDQYGRNHILFAKDLCLYLYLGVLGGTASYRVEAQDYTPEWVGRLAAFYRGVLDAAPDAAVQTSSIEEIAAGSPRKLGVGAFRFQE